MNLRAVDDGKTTVAAVEGEKEIGASEQDRVSALFPAKLTEAFMVRSSRSPAPPA
jgi:hypothetical protein